VGGVSGNLVPQALRGNDGNLGLRVSLPWLAACHCVCPYLIADALVGLEVERQLGVVTLNDDLGGLLDGLCSDATHFGDFV
jgi:hypothetical protein